MAKLYFIEYIKPGNSDPVNCTVGLHSFEESLLHGRKIASENNYCGFWISVKPAVTGVSPTRLSYHRAV